MFYAAKDHSGTNLSQTQVYLKCPHTHTLAGGRSSILFYSTPPSSSLYSVISLFFHTPGFFHWLLSIYFCVSKLWPCYTSDHTVLDLVKCEESRSVVGLNADQSKPLTLCQCCVSGCKLWSGMCYFDLWMALRQCIRLDRAKRGLFHSSVWQILKQRCLESTCQQQLLATIFLPLSRLFSPSRVFTVRSECETNDEENEEFGSITPSDASKSYLVTDCSCSCRTTASVPVVSMLVAKVRLGGKGFVPGIWSYKVICCKRFATNRTFHIEGDHSSHVTSKQFTSWLKWLL